MDGRQIEGFFGLSTPKALSLDRFPRWADIFVSQFTHLKPKLQPEHSIIGCLVIFFGF